MARFTAFALLLLLAACGRESPPPQPRTERKPASPAPAAPPPNAAERRESRDAADALREYYARVAAGDYAGAYRLRTGGGVDADRFARSFAPYRTYSALVGTPSAPVAADGFLYVQLPVMITGTTKQGRPFGSGGNVMMRRPAGGGRWLVLADR